MPNEASHVSCFAFVKIGSHLLTKYQQKMYYIY